MAYAFEQFDMVNDNFVSKQHFRAVLQEFGFTVSALDLETLIAR